jgi:hypothetical protein
MRNYQKTKIYKIVSDLGNMVYVDSTAKEYLSQRLQQHRHDYKQWKNSKKNYLPVFEMFEKYGVENCKIILIESFACNSKDEKTSRTDIQRRAHGNRDVNFVQDEASFLADTPQIPHPN